jgi:hypothetical protein
MQTESARPNPFASNEDWAAAGIALPSPDSDYWVAHVEAVGPLTLLVRHRDGVEGTVRFEQSALRGVFEVLSDPAVFARVRAEDGVVSWPDEIDISPDNMHRHLFAFGEWVLQ